MSAFGTLGKTDRCVVCGDKYSANSDWPACSQVCAAEAFARMVLGAQARGMDWKSLLPWDQRPDTVPWKAWQAATKLQGKNHWRRTRTS